MEEPSSQNPDQQLGNSKMKYKLDRLVLMFLFQFLFLCSHSLEIRNHSTVIWISMERMVLNSTLNGKQSQPDGKMMVNSLNYQQHSQLTNEYMKWNDRFKLFDYPHSFINTKLWLKILINAIRYSIFFSIIKN